MTTKGKIILIAAMTMAYSIGVVILASNLSNSARQVHGGIARAIYPINLEDHEPSPAPRTDLKGKYKVEEEKADCPVCLEEGINVVKPFKCDHVLCEACLEGMGKANATGNRYEVNIMGIPLAGNYKVNLVCPLCRTELRETTQAQTAEASH